MHTQRLIVTLEKEARNRFDDIVADLKAEGLAVDRTMKTIGSVVGSITAKTKTDHEKRHRAIAAVKGVQAVEEEGVESVPPPGSPVE
jgi:hypothetical protein